MAAFTELDWTRFDVDAIVANRGIAAIEERRRIKCRDWLRRNGYGIESLDCSQGLEHAIPELGRMLRWEQQFGYALTPNTRSLDALRDGFEFDVPMDGGKVFEVVRADIAWREDARWLLGLLAIAQEFSLHQLALGKRFFSLLVIAENSPLIGQTYETNGVSVPFWTPSKEARFDLKS